ncbi:MAG: hypothetical protein ACO3B3_03185 [Cyanobium sp.]
MAILRHRLSSLACTSLLGGAMLLAAAPALALNLRPSLPGFSGGNLGGDPSFSGSLGYSFSLNQSQTITALGFYDASEDGLLSSHGIGLYEATSQTLLASATVPAGSDSWLQNGFRWVPIPSLSLLSGSYVIAATSSGDPALFDPFLYETTAVDGIDGLVIGTSLSESGSGTVVAFPSQDEGLAQGFFGPAYAIAGTPGPLPLLGAGAALGWSRRLRLRRRLVAAAGAGGAGSRP